MAKPFTEFSVKKFFEMFQETLFTQIDALETKEIRDVSMTDMADRYIGYSNIEPIQIDDTRTICKPFEDEHPLRLTLHLFFTGAPKLFQCYPDAMMQFPEGERQHQGEYTELVFEYYPTAEEAVIYFEHIKSVVLKLVRAINREVEVYMRRTQDDIRARVQKRYERMAKNDKILATVPYLLTREPNPPTALTIAPIERIATIVPHNISRQEWTPELELKEYEHILSIMKSMSLVLERSPDAFSKMREDHLRWLFVVSLNGHYKNQVTGETFNGAGKCDILIKAKSSDDRDGNVFVAECKIWKGQEDFTKAIGQLLDYITFNDTKACLVVFSRERNFEGVLKAIRATAPSHDNFLNEISRDKTETRYSFRQKDNPDQTLILTVLAFTIYPQGTRQERTNARNAPPNPAAAQI